MPAGREEQHPSRRISVDGKPSSGKLTGEEQVAATAEGEAFGKAKQAYLERDYRKALTRFSRFINKYPHSKFAADASLYRADCFLRLSGE
ncbi:MAG TPA: hypothetical protein DCZ75_16060 [Geobacter sp.]|nr:hypothetical protein [Geobacter sp.]